MKCEYCGTEITAIPEDRCCPGCGAPVVEKAKPVFPKPPEEIYYNADREQLRLTEDSVVFYKHAIAALGKPATLRTVPYSELTKVAYSPAKFLRGGYLCVRGLQEKEVPVSANSSETIADGTAIMFPKKYNARFLQAYTYLQKCAEIANAAREEK